MLGKVKYSSIGASSFDGKECTLFNIIGMLNSFRVGKASNAPFSPTIITFFTPIPLKYRIDSLISLGYPIYI